MNSEDRNAMRGLNLSGGLVMYLVIAVSLVLVKFRISGQKNKNVFELLFIKYDIRRKISILLYLSILMRLNI